MRIGIAGLGIVGGTVFEMLDQRSRDIGLKTEDKFIVSKVLTRTPSRYKTLKVPGTMIAHDFDDLIINSEIIIEAIGGTTEALKLVDRALRLNRIVVTPNKELISEYGNKLNESIKDNKMSLFFEAAVGGGIPIISVLENYLISQKVKKIRGILNGTTNYILTEMEKGLDFNDSLKRAQELGYAEADPSNDVKGYDTAYKLSVLSGVVSGTFCGISPIKVQGIENVTRSQVEEAIKKEKKLKLIGEIDFEKNTTKVRIEQVDKTDPFWNLEGVENAVEVNTDLAGNFFLRGRGAGGYPTATAVIADLFRVSRYMGFKDITEHSVVVMKFGGTSVGTIKKIKSVAKQVTEKTVSGIKPVVVVSAMGKTTDKLMEQANEITSKPDTREMDVLFSTGEQQAVALMTMALQSMGKDAASFSGNQLRIITDEKHTASRILDIDTESISRYIGKNCIPVVAGFQGITREGEITTLGRGGSDTTAIALTHSLGADLCEIYTDVDGVYTADPRMEKNARLIKELSWEEMIELSKHGAQVMQARAVEFARKYGIKILVKNARYDARGTLIWEGYKMEEPIVRAVSSEKNIIKIVLHEVPDKPGVAARVLRTLSDQNITIDMILQSMRSGNVNSMAFIIPDSELERFDSTLMKKRSGAKEIIVEKEYAKVSLVGVNLTASPDIAATLFETLANEGMNIDMISATNSRVSVILKSDKIKDAVHAIHSSFRLDEV